MLKNWFSIEGKVALVSRGYRGLGLSITKDLAFFLRSKVGVPLSNKTIAILSKLNGILE